MRQHVLPAPADRVVAPLKRGLPAVVVRRPAPHVDLRIHRRTAAEHVALRDVVPAPVEMRLRLGGVVAHELRAADHLEDARRHVEQRVPVRMPALEQQNPPPTLARELRGQDASRGTAADDDVIEGLGHIPSPKVARTNSQAAMRCRSSAFSAASGSRAMMPSKIAVWLAKFTALRSGERGMRSQCGASQVR